MTGRRVTVGIDIGTTSVKALAVDADGVVVARARVPHEVFSPRPDTFEHDADRAWHHDVVEAYEQVRPGLDVVAVNVAAMVPSLAAVDADGHALTPGLLYGDARGGEVTGRNPSESGELLHLLEWCSAAAPDAAGYWPAQAMANHALSGVGAIDTVVAMTAVPLFDYTGWDAAVVAGAGARPAQLPVIVAGSDAIGRTADGALVGPGTVDAFGEQLVAGADCDGDVLVILGTTLITWAVVSEPVDAAGLWSLPHTAPGKWLVGGPSNAGGLFLNWAQGLLAPSDEATDPTRIPVWLPYVRGERTPLHDPNRRAALHDLDLTHGPTELRRGAFEASGFVVRHHLELAGALGGARRIVATGGGVHVQPWVQAIADATGLPVDVVAVPEGGALGAAYMARVTAGLEESTAEAGKWARVARRVDPDPTWTEPMERRYRRFVELTGPVAESGSRTGA